MVNIADKIFNFLRKRFVKTNGRFPTPKEADDILDDAQKAVSDAVQQNLEQYADMGSPQEIISKTLSQDPETIYLNAERYRAEGGAPMSDEMREAMPKAQIEAMPLKDPTLRERAMRKKLEALNEQSKVNLEKSGAKARAKVQKDKEGLESMMDQIPVRDDTPEIGEVIDQTQRSRMPMRLIEDYGTELSKEQLIKEGYTPTQADILMRARKKMLSGEEINPNEALLRVKEETADEMGIDVDDVDPEGFDFEIDYAERDDFAEGGRSSIFEFFNKEPSRRMEPAPEAIEGQPAPRLPEGDYMEPVQEKTPNEMFIDLYKQGKYDNLQMAINDADRYQRGEMTHYEKLTGRKPFEQGGVASTKDFIESTGESELMDIYIKVMDGTLPEDALTKALERRGYKTYAEGGIVDTRQGYQFGGPALKYIREAMRKARQRSGVSKGEPMFQRFSSELKEKVGDDIVDTPRGQYSIADADKLRKRGTVQLLLDELKLIENIEKQQGVTGIPGDVLEDFGKKFMSSDKETASNAFFDFVKTMNEYGIGGPGKSMDDMIRAEKGMTIEGIEEAKGALELYRRNLEGRKLNAEGGLNYLMGF